MGTTVHVGHSPDPDDAFMFYALSAGKIDTGEECYEHHLLDIETLNKKAECEAFEVTALSIHAYAYLSDKYALLPHGASFGDGYGPMVVARPEAFDGSDPVAWLDGKRIAIPGERTSAILALRLFAAGLEGTVGDDVGPRFEAVTLPFDRIIEAVRAQEFDGGLIIHEGQLTYAEGPRGLAKVVDLGAWWKGETGGPLPLGGNGVRKALGQERIARISEHLRQSIEWGLAHREEALDHALKYARDMGREKADAFVGMYVNDYTLAYGEQGEAAVRRFLAAGRRAGLLAVDPAPEWVTG